MSEFRRVKAKGLDSNVDMAILEESLKELDLEIDTRKKRVKNAYGSADVDFGLKYKNKPIDLGFIKTKEGGIELSGDPFMAGIKGRLGDKIRDRGHQKIMDEISQIYQKNLIVNKITMNSNFSAVVDENSVKNSEEIIIHCYK